jgi:hypothetical protein
MGLLDVPSSSSVQRPGAPAACFSFIKLITPPPAVLLSLPSSRPALAGARVIIYRLVLPAWQRLLLSVSGLFCSDDS